MTTVNRGKLWRAIQAGKLQAKCLFHYTDDYAYDAASKYGRTDWLPAWPIPDSGSYSTPEGKIGIGRWELHSKSGRAYIDDKGDMVLRVHGNLVYHVRLVA